MFFYELQVTFHNSFFTNPFWGTACEIFCLLRSSRSEVFCKKGVVRNFEKFIGKHLCQSLLFNKVAGLRPASLLKKRLWHWCFPVNFATFLRAPFHRTYLNDCFSTIQYFLAENPIKVLNGQQQYKGVTFHWARISLYLVKLFESPSLRSSFIM